MVGGVSAPACNRMPICRRCTMTEELECLFHSVNWLEKPESWLPTDLNSRIERDAQLFRAGTNSACDRHFSSLAGRAMRASCARLEYIPAHDEPFWRSSSPRRCALGRR